MNKVCSYVCQGTAMGTKFASTYVRERPWEHSLLLRMSGNSHGNKVCFYVCQGTVMRCFHVRQGTVMGTKFAPTYVEELSWEHSLLIRMSGNSHVTKFAVTHVEEL